MLSWLSSFLPWQKHQNSQDNPHAQAGWTQSGYPGSHYSQMGLAQTTPGMFFQPAGTQGGFFYPPNGLPNAFGMPGFYPAPSYPGSYPGSNPVFHPGSLIPPGVAPPLYWTGYQTPPAPPGK